MTGKWLPAATEPPQKARGHHLIKRSWTFVSPAPALSWKGQLRVEKAMGNQLQLHLEIDKPGWRENISKSKRNQCTEEEAKLAKTKSNCIFQKKTISFACMAHASPTVPPQLAASRNLLLDASVGAAPNPGAVSHPRPVGGFDRERIGMLASLETE